MKPLSYSLIAAAIACGFVSAQTTAYTTPVGYVTSYIAANASVPPNPNGAATFIAASLAKPTTYAGAATASPSGLKTIALAAGVPTTLDATSVLEITDGVSEGWWSAIVSSTTDSITITDNFPAGLAANVKVSVRKFTTIQDVFGANAPGLTGDDNIQVLDPVGQSTSTIIYVGGASPGWYDFVTEAAAGGVIIYPGTAVLVVHYANTILPVVVTGEVRTTKTQVDVYPADNWLGQPNPTGGTLGSMLFGPQMLTTDFLNIIAPDQVTDSYISFSSAMYNFVTEAAADTIPIAGGNGYIINRPVGAASVITIPAQVVAP